MKRMLLVTALALLTIGSASGCRLFQRRGDHCDPCSVSQNNCGTVLGGATTTTVHPGPAPSTTNYPLPEPTS